MDSTYLCFGLIGAGFLLLVAELFIPTGGVLCVLSLAAIAVGVVLTFQVSAATGLLTLLGVFVALPILAGLMLYIWPRTPLGKRFFLTSPEEDATLASTTMNKDLEQLRGRIGRTLSALRPAGVVDFDGRRIDTITEGMMVDPDQWVRVIDVKAGKVIVRPIDKPKLDDLETADFG